MEMKTRELIERRKDELTHSIYQVKRRNALERDCSTRTNITIVLAEDYYAPSEIYVRNKISTLNSMGIDVNVLVTPKDKWSKLDTADTSSDLIDTIRAIKNTDGIIVQLPYPKIDPEMLASIIPSELDIDGMTYTQRGMLGSSNRNNVLEPCTAKGVMYMIENTLGTNLNGKSIAIINRSPLIGLPLSRMAIEKNMCPMVFNSNVSMTELKEMTNNFDIIITGCGKRAIFDSTWFKKAKLIIDCSMDKDVNVKPTGVGDCDKEDFLYNRKDVIIASGYGHTGPMTILSLAENVLNVIKYK